MYDRLSRDQLGSGTSVTMHIAVEDLQQLGAARPEAIEHLSSFQIEGFGGLHICKLSAHRGLGAVKRLDAESPGMAAMATIKALQLGNTSTRRSAAQLFGLASTSAMTLTEQAYILQIVQKVSGAGNRKQSTVAAVWEA